LKYIPWIIGVIAVWLMAAPFLLGYENTTPAMWNDLAVGVLTLLSAAFWSYREWGDGGQSSRMN
jgi:hypothetical protein